MARPANGRKKSLAGGGGGVGGVGGGGGGGGWCWWCDAGCW